MYGTGYDLIFVKDKEVAPPALPLFMRLKNMLTWLRRECLGVFLRCWLNG